MLKAIFFDLDGVARLGEPSSNLSLRGSPATEAISATPCHHP